MINSSDDVQTYLKEGRSIVGKGWKEVESFEELDDADEYESEDEEMYVVMDLGQAVDNKAFLSENTYQLIGLDTPMPFLKIANQVFQGEVTQMIGDEIIFGRIRNEENPHEPSRPPWHVTSNRLSFRPVTLRPKHESKAPDPPAKTRVIQSAVPKRITDVDMTATTTTTTTIPAPDAPAPKKRGRPRKVPIVTPTAPLPSQSEILDPALTTQNARAGPSRLRDSATPATAAEAADDGVEGSVGGDVNMATTTSEPASPAARPRKRPVEKIHIATIEDLQEILSNPMAPSNRYSLDPELLAQFRPQTNRSQAKNIAERGYTPTELRRLVEGQPLRGKARTTIQEDYEREAEINKRLMGGSTSVGGDGTGTPGRFVLATKMADTWPDRLDLKVGVRARGVAGARDVGEDVEGISEGAGRLGIGRTGDGAAGTGDVGGGAGGEDGGRKKLEGQRKGDAGTEDVEMEDADAGA